MRLAEYRKFVTAHLWALMSHFEGRKLCIPNENQFYIKNNETSVLKPCFLISEGKAQYKIQVQSKRVQRIVMHGQQLVHFSVGLVCFPACQLNERCAA